MTNEILNNDIKVKSNETFSQKFFTTNGRINRMTFFKRSLAVTVIGFLLAFMAGLIYSVVNLDSANVEQSTEIVIFAVLLLSLIPQYCLNTKRLHDIGKDETLAKIFIGVEFLGSICIFSTMGVAEIVSIISSTASFIFTAYLIFKKGDADNNEYGASN